MEPLRIFTTDGETNDGGRRLAIVQPPIDFTIERLKRRLRVVGDLRAVRQPNL